MRKSRTPIICGLALAFAVIFADAPVSLAAQRTFVVHGGTLIEAKLNKRLRADRVRGGERFTMTVTSPREYRNATIYGYVSDARRSGRLSGRSEMTLNFDRIRLRDGRTYDFAGTIEDVRTTTGERFDVDREGAVQEDSQTGRAVGRAAAGAVAGTIIGTIAGGGSGAAKGAIIGGGIGVGSVLVQGRRDLDLSKNTLFVIRASSPRSRY
jgi:hypothetical protein